jgi:hypothetical protein
MNSTTPIPFLQSHDYIIPGVGPLWPPNEKANAILRGEKKIPKIPKRTKKNMVPDNIAWAQRKENSVAKKEWRQRIKSEKINHGGGAPYTTDDLRKKRRKKSRKEKRKREKKR